MAEDRVLRASCHCGQHSYSFKVPSTSLPITQQLCHCDTSRRISGCLFTSYVPIPPSNQPPSLSGLAKYQSSGILDRYYCATCSTHLYLHYNEDGHFEVSHGSLEGKIDDVLAFTEHMWIEDTKDGGGSVWIKDFKSEPTKRWRSKPEQSPLIPLDWRAAETCSSTDEKLRVHCHCQGVEFFIARPSEESLKASSPLPDLLVPYWSGESAANPGNKPWWLSSDRTKYLAGNCACDSCRKVAGFDVVSWAFIPVASLSLSNNAPFKLPFGTMQSYKSADKRLRWFCSGCGANVLWTSEERPTLIDVSVGLIDAPSGARAEEWLQWDSTDRVSFKEDAHNTHLVRALEDGLIDYSAKT